MKYYKLSGQDLWLINDLHRQMDIVARRKCFSEEDEKAKNKRLNELNLHLNEILDDADMRIPNIEVEAIIRNDPMTQGVTFFNFTDEEGCDHLVRVEEDTKTCLLNKGKKVRIVGQMINNFGTIKAYEITEA